ncbi:MAG: hypothetical protein Q7J73_08025, partial [Dehalococcoidales bacterium]|nr:hypothetical protein [Dehalococcoidales bacterium]
MSYLYAHREQLGDNKRLAEIAYSVTFSIPPDDREDVEQKIVVDLIEVKKKATTEHYLWKAARHMVARYWEHYYREKERALYFRESNQGEVTDVDWKYLSASDGTDARLDAVAILSTLPPRLIAIGLKKLNGEPLTNAEILYRHKRRNKLKPNRPTGCISGEEKQRVIDLNRKRLNNDEIARATGRSALSVRNVLKEAGLNSAYQSQIDRVRQEKEELVRQAYFVERKSIIQIAIETHTWRKTVRQVVRA